MRRLSRPTRGPPVPGKAGAGTALGGQHTAVQTCLVPTSPQAGVGGSWVGKVLLLYPAWNVLGY